MNEDFRYDDGSVQNRHWDLQIDQNGAIKATTTNIVGESEGFQIGSSVQLKYRLRLPKSAGVHVLNTVD